MVAGPSGAGKDTLINLAASAFGDEPRLRIARRAVTRAATPHEDHDSLSVPAFEAQESAGVFGLSWRAHGLCYGIAKSELDTARDVVIANVSRTVLAEGRRIAARVGVVLITASPDKLAERRAARGRDEEDASRTSRQALDDQARGIADLVIENDGPLALGAATLQRYLAGLLASD